MKIIRKRLIVIVFLQSLFLGGSFAQTATAPSGSGTSSDPYKIATLNNLYWVTQNSQDVSKMYIKQTADIDASSSSSWNGGKGFTPIGDSGFVNCYYDGAGHTINGIYINDPSRQLVGLFSDLEFGSVKNLGLTNVNITGGKYVGAIAGEDGSSNYDYCYSTGSVKGDTIVGGLIGATGSAENPNWQNQIPSHWIGCYSSASVDARYEAGGLMGIATGNMIDTTVFTITNCYYSGTVFCSNLAGGITSSLQDAILSNSYATGTVFCSILAGGITGQNHYSTIKNCFFYGKFNFGTGLDDGGIVGYNSGGVINNCYAVFSYYTTFGVDEVANHIGGLVGLNHDSGTAINSFWDTTYSGSVYSAIGDGKTTSQMKSSITFLTSGWDPSVWYRDNSYNSGYPYLAWQKPTGTSLLAPFVPSGNGTSADPYRIASLNNLLWLSQDSSSWGSHFIQTSDIDASTTKTWDSGQVFHPLETALHFLREITMEKVIQLTICTLTGRH